MEFSKFCLETRLKLNLSQESLFVMKVLNLSYILAKGNHLKFILKKKLKKL